MGEASIWICVEVRTVIRSVLFLKATGPQGCSSYDHLDRVSSLSQQVQRSNRRRPGPIIRGRESGRDRGLRFEHPTRARGSQQQCRQAAAATAGPGSFRADRPGRQLVGKARSVRWRGSSHWPKNILLRLAWTRMLSFDDIRPSLAVFFVHIGRNGSSTWG